MLDINAIHLGQFVLLNGASAVVVGLEPVVVVLRVLPASVCVHSYARIRYAVQSAHSVRVWLGVSSTSERNVRVLL